MPNDKNRLYTNDDLNKDSKDIAKRRTSSQFSRFTTATSTSLAALSLNPPSPAVQIESNPQIGVPINDSYGSLGLITQIIPLNVYGSSYSIITVTDDISFAFQGIPKGRHIEFTLDILIDKEELPLPIINLTGNNILNPPTLPPLENGMRLVLHFEGVNDATGLRFVYIGGTISGEGGLVFPINYPEKDAVRIGAITLVLDFADTDRHSSKYTITDNISFVFTNPPANKTATVFIEIVQDETGEHSVLFLNEMVNREEVEAGIKLGANETTIVRVVWLYGVFYGYIEGGGGLNADLSNLAQANAIPFDLNVNFKGINNVNTINFINNTAEITGLRALRFIATEENPINLFTAPNTLTIKTVDSLRFSFSGGLLFEMSEVENSLIGPNITLSGTINAGLAIIQKSLLLNAAENYSPVFADGEIKLLTDRDDVRNVWIYSGERDRNVSDFIIASAIDQSLIPTPGEAHDVGSVLFPWKDTYIQSLRLITGGEVPSNIATIASERDGMILSILSGDTFSFRESGSTEILSLRKDSMRFRTAGSRHRIDAEANSIDIVAETQNDSVQLWTGLQHAAQITGKFSTMWKNGIDQPSAYFLQIYQDYGLTPFNGLPIGFIQFIGPNSDFQDTNYAYIQVDCADVSSGSEDGIFRILVESSGRLLRAIEIAGDTNANPKMGFFNTTAVSQPRVTGTLTDLINALVSLGLVRR